MTSRSRQAAYSTNGILGEGRICQYLWRDQLGKLIEFWSFVRIDIVIKLVVELVRITVKEIGE